LFQILFNTIFKADGEYWRGSGMVNLEPVNQSMVWAKSQIAYESYSTKPKK